MNEAKQLDLFFWLGVDGEPVSLTEEEFEGRIEDERRNLEEWLNVSSSN